MIDELLIKQLLSGDRTAMEKLIRRYYDKIYRYCYVHVKDVQTAQDLTQETFYSIIAHIGEYVHYDKFQNYLYVVAGNKCKDYYRKKKPLYMEELPEHGASLPGGHGEGETELVDRLYLRQLVEELPEELAEAVILRFYQDLKYQDVAKVLGISLSLAKYRVKKAVSLLKNELERS